jgi:hypothetical protein
MMISDPRTEGRINTTEVVFKEGDFIAAILDAVPVAVFVVDEDVNILAYNQAATDLLSNTPQKTIRGRAGEILHCVNSIEGCGRSSECGRCFVRGAVEDSRRLKRVVRGKARMEQFPEGEKKGIQEIYLSVTAAPFPYLDKPLTLLILQDISELTMLKRILPICSHCKKIRNDDQYWDSVEKYFADHLDLAFSHGICPECVERFYPEFAKNLKS